MSNIDSDITNQEILDNYKNKIEKENSELSNNSIEHKVYKAKQFLNAIENDVFLIRDVKEIAKEHKVVIVENKMLARALYASVEISQSVPHELYQAVAEVLAYVYKLKKRVS